MIPLIANPNNRGPHCRAAIIVWMGPVELSLLFRSKIQWRSPFQD